MPRTQSNTVKHRILLVDNHPILRYGLSLLIEETDDLELCGQCISAAEALPKIKSLYPDIVIVDSSLHKSTPIELVKSIKDIAPDTPVLMLSMRDDKIYAERTLRAGAAGYIIKQDPLNLILKAIYKTVGGGIYTSPALSAANSQNSADSATENGIDKFGVDNLSDRELEVFEFIGRGQSSRDIAERLQLSIKTIETHRSHIKQKLKINTAIELTHRAFHWIESGNA
jgi:DNA-binding NarL/FixJ family response regulator